MPGLWGIVARGSRNLTEAKFEESFIAGAALFKRTTGRSDPQMRASLETIAAVGAGFGVRRRVAADRA